jgi:hypothetical protein
MAVADASPAIEFCPRQHARQHDGDLMVVVPVEFLRWKRNAKHATLPSIMKMAP